MASPVQPTLAPVRAAVPPVVATPPATSARRARIGRPPAPSLAVLAVGSVLAIGGMLAFGWSMLPRPHGGLLHAPVARTLAGACVTSPFLCGSHVPSP